MSTIAHRFSCALSGSIGVVCFGMGWSLGTRGSYTLAHPNASKNDTLFARARGAE